MENEIQLSDEKINISIVPFEHKTRYTETNEQGIIQRSNYYDWMEDARLNLLEQMGLGYKQMEELEIMSPTISEKMEYRSPVRFDETVLIDTKLVSYDGHNMEIAYKLYDKKTGEIRAIAGSRHCFVNKSGIPISLNRIYPELETRFFERK